MFGWVFKLAGLFLGGNPLDRILTTVDKKFDNDTEREKIKATIVQAHLVAETQALTVQASTLKGDKIVSWARGAFCATAWAYWSSIVADSMFHLDWKIAAIPAPYDSIVFTIVGAVFVTDGFKKIIRG